MRAASLYVWCRVLAVCLCFIPTASFATDEVRLSAPATLVETGLLQYVLPRFSLKTGVRLTIVEDGDTADLILSPDPDGPPVFAGPQNTWHLGLESPDNKRAARFADWLRSEVGQRTITSFQVDGAAPYTLPEQEEVEVVTLTFEGDPVKGQDLSVIHCARCHAVNEATRINTIGSTPSFFALKAMKDWDIRFQTFYILNPHPAFTQIEDVTFPFPIDRPSPIVPMEITLDELDAILAYVDSLQPANLGAPVQHQ